MALNLWWMLVIIFGLVMANLWLLRRNKKRVQNTPEKAIREQKTTEGGVTGTIAAGTGTDGSRIKQVDTDNHHGSSDAGSDGGSGSGGAD